MTEGGGKELRRDVAKTASPTTGTIEALRVVELFEQPGLRSILTLVAGHAGLTRRLSHTRIQKPGLALVGHYHGIVPERVQILGETEITFLRSLGEEVRQQALLGFFSLGLSLVIVTAKRKDDLLDLLGHANSTGVPIALSSERSSATIAALHEWLDERLAPRTTLHGVLVDVFGQGLLLLGPSGIGKSECGLELVMRGHRLVADDIIQCEQRGGLIFGTPPELLRHHIEVRGLGVLNINHLFGVTAVRARKRIDLVVRLTPWREDGQYDRMGVDDHFHEILGLPIREIALPVQPGRSMASILEIAARNELARGIGVHSAREFFARFEVQEPPPEFPSQPRSRSSLPPPTSRASSSSGSFRIPDMEGDKNE